MAEMVNMPKLGFDMAEGTLIRWVVSEGDDVQEGQVLAEIETDKATVEVESPASGVVHKHLVDEGTILPVGEPIAVIGEPEEEIDLQALEPSREEAEPEAEAAEAPPKPAAEGEAPSEETQPRYPGGVKASPVARRIADERDLDLAAISGSGPGGRVVKRDVEEALERRAGEPVEGIPARMPSMLEPRESERVPLTKLRAAIGRRMTQAKQQMPHFYITIDVDAAPMMTLRKELNAALGEEEKLSVNDFIVKAAALALREFPNLNASLQEDAILRHGEINVGIAVAVEDGLLTVVIRDADRKPLRRLSYESRQMASRAREGRVRSEDIEGSTFTVSNLGMFDVHHFVAIVNPPEAAILATGSVQEAPVIEEGEIKPGQRLQCTLSADHRVTDGAEAARWLQVFRAYLENPVRLLL